MYKKIVIVGSGLFGLTIAERIASVLKREVIVLEKGLTLAVTHGPNLTIKLVSRYISTALIFFILHMKAYGSM